MLAIVAGVEVDPVDRPIRKQRGGRRRLRDDQRDERGIAALNDVAVQLSCEGAAAVGNRRAVVVLAARTFGAAAEAGVDADDRNGLAALRDGVTERAQAPAEKIAHLEKP